MKVSRVKRTGIIVFFLGCFGALIVPLWLAHWKKKTLHTISDSKTQLMHDIIAVFDANHEHVKELLLRTSDPEKLPTGPDLFFVPDNKKIQGLEQLAIDVATMLSVCITDTPYICAGYPCIHQGKYRGMVVAVFDPKNIQNLLAAQKKQLGSDVTIEIAKENRFGLEAPDTGTILFSTSEGANVAQQKFSLQIQQPISLATTNSFGSSIDEFDTKIIASARDFFIFQRWGISVSQDITRQVHAANMFYYLSLAIAALGLLLLLLALAFSHTQWARTFIQWQQVLFCAFMGLALVVASIVFFHMLQRYRVSVLQARQTEIAKAKTDVQFTAALFIQHSYDIQAIVDTAFRTYAGSSTLQTYAAALPEGAAFGINNTYVQKVKNKLIEDSAQEIPWEQTHGTAGFWKTPGLQKVPGKDLFIIYAKPLGKDYLWAGFSFDLIKKLLANLGPDRLQSIVMFGADGSIIFHPNINFMRHSTPAHNLMRTNKRGNLGISELLPGFQWTMLVNYPQRDFLTFGHELFIKFAKVLICLVLLLILFCAFVVNSIRTFVPCYSLILLGGIITLIVASYRQYDAQDAALLNSYANIARLREHLSELGDKKFTPIKTGIEIRHFEIVSPNQIKFVAHVWQKINRATAPDAQFGFSIINEVVPAHIKKLSEQRDGQIERIDWEVNGTIYQVNPEYVAVPFDNQKISIRLAPLRDSQALVFLEPDLSEYASLLPSSKAGISSGFVMKDFVIEKSYFNNVGTQDAPVTAFTIVVKRNLLSVLLQYVLSLFILLITIYMISLVVAVESIVRIRIAVITAVSGLFFGLIILHQNYRASLVIPGISYLEWLMAAVYVLLGFSFLNALFWIDKPESRPYKMALFWPCLMTYMFIVTIATFV